MPRTRTEPTPARRKAEPRPTVSEVTENATAASGGAPDAEAGPEDKKPTEGQGEARRTLPELPRAKTTLSGVLETKTVLLFGPAGVGKSTMASEWADGKMLFFDAAGELSDLEVYRHPVGSWLDFRAGCASYAAEMNGDDPFYAGCVLDTADMLGTFCAQRVRALLKITHESDADWGKGWAMVREEFASNIAKLAALPGGVVLVSHSKTEEIKKRNEVYDRSVPTLTGGARDACVNGADLVLFVDYDDDGGRVIFTKPGKYHEAKERGMKPRLPASIPWPVGRSGWEVLKEAWYA